MTDKPITDPFTEFPIPPPVAGNVESADSPLIYQNVRNLNAYEYNAIVTQALSRVFVYQNPPATYARILALLAELGISEGEYRGWNQEG